MPDNCHVAAWRCSQIDLIQVRGGLKQQEIYSKARRTLPVPTIFLRASSVFFFVLFFCGGGDVRHRAVIIVMEMKRQMTE